MIVHQLFTLFFVAGKEENKENTVDLGRGKRSVVLNDQTRNKTTNEDKRKERQKVTRLRYLFGCLRVEVLKAYCTRVDDDYAL